MVFTKRIQDLYAEYCGQPINHCTRQMSTSTEKILCYHRLIININITLVRQIMKMEMFDNLTGLGAVT